MDNIEKALQTMYDGGDKNIKMIPKLVIRCFYNSPCK